MAKQSTEKKRQSTESKRVRWMLIGVLVVGVAIADWHTGGIGPRLVLGSATLHLTSEPDAATAYVNGEPVGQTPVRDYSVRPGATVVRLEHRFHDTAVRRLSARRSEVLDVHVEFPPVTGSLEVVTNPRGADVLVDGEELDGVTPVTLSPHATGAFEIAVSIHGRESKTRVVEVLPGEHTEASFELERVAMSEIHIARSPRDLELRIDDEPYKPGMTLPVGVYKLSAQRAGYAPLEKVVKFVDGRNDEAIKLVRLRGSLALAVDPPDARVDVSYRDAGGWRKVRYSDEMRVPTGPVTVEARAMGYRGYQRRLTVDATPLSHAIRLQKYDVEAGRQFSDSFTSGGEGPLMVVIDVGSFRMGSDAGPLDERPSRQVEIAQPFAIGVFETTRGDFGKFRAVTGSPPSSSAAQPGHPPLASRDRLPVTGVTWEDSRAYVDWLSEATGHRYRLPSESEWEYVARAGSTGRYHFGNDAAAICAHANVADSTYGEMYAKPGIADCSDNALRPAAVGGYVANALGVYDMLGNVEEWVADCWHDDYKDAPGDQRARNGDCASHVVRGGAWDSAPGEATVSYRSFSDGGSNTRGFRVVREL